MSERSASPRVALITGGTRGLGAAIGRMLASQGVAVAAGYLRDDDAAESWRRSIVGSVPTSVHRADVGEPGSGERLVGEVLDVHGRLDLLVNNAGSLEEHRLTTISPDVWETTIRRNLSGAFFVAQAAIAHMETKRFGRIVNVGSVSAAMGSAFQIDYATAKAGLVGLTRSLSRAVARRGITVNCVIPGAFETELLAGMTITDRKVVERGIPVGRFGRPEELAHLVTALLADEAGYVTGAVMVVDGGLSMGT